MQNTKASLQCCNGLHGFNMFGLCTSIFVLKPGIDFDFLRMKNQVFSLDRMENPLTQQLDAITHH